MTALYEDQVKLARALVHPEKEQRDSCYDDLVVYVEKLKTCSDLEMLKLWKALYYCLWLSDKLDVQLEVISFLSSLFQKFKNDDLKILCVRMLYRTILREWQYLDQHRIDKIYRLIRASIRETFSYLYQKNWNQKLTNGFITALAEEILQKTPNGVRFQCADIFLSELHTATEGKIETSHFLICSSPFLIGATNTKTDSVFRERVSSAVFSAFVSRFARENASAAEGEEPPKIFENVDTKFLQGTIFEMASAETDLGCRKRLYGLHALFPPVTGEAFVDLAALAEAPETSSKKRKTVEKSEQAEKPKKSKSKGKKA